MSHLLSLNQQDVPNYYREFDHDLTVIKPEELSATRLVLIVLPYVSLYKPASFLLSAGMGSCRAVTNISRYWAGEGSFLETAVSVAALVSTILAHPLGLLVSTVHDIGIEGRGIIPQQVTIESGKTTTQDIEVDTGIR